MSVTTVDPITALVVIDLQKGVLAIPAVHDVDGVLGNARRLVTAFRDRGLPVAIVTVAGGAPGRTEQPPRTGSFPADFDVPGEGLEPAPGDIAVVKSTWGAFASTDLEARLRERGVTQVVLVGIATTAGVESTARQAYEAGFNVTLAIDAMTDRSLAAHEHSVGAVFPRIGETGTTEDILALLPSA